MAKVTIYTRKFCGYCSAAKDLLRRKEASVTEHDGTFNSDIRNEMIQKAKGASTFPQIFIGDEHVGGCDELFALEGAGKLDAKIGRAHV